MSHNDWATDTWMLIVAVAGALAACGLHARLPRDAVTHLAFLFGVTVFVAGILRAAAQIGWDLGTQRAAAEVAPPHVFVDPDDHKLDGVEYVRCAPPGVLDVEGQFVTCRCPADHTYNPTFCRAPAVLTYLVHAASCACPTRDGGAP